MALVVPVTPAAPGSQVQPRLELAGPADGSWIWSSGTSRRSTSWVQPSSSAEGTAPATSGSSRSTEARIVTALSAPKAGDDGSGLLTDPPAGQGGIIGARRGWRTAVRRPGPSSDAAPSTLSAPLWKRTMRPMLPAGAQECQIGTFDADFPRIRYAVPSLIYIADSCSIRGQFGRLRCRQAPLSAPLRRTAGPCAARRRRRRRGERAPIVGRPSRRSGPAPARGDERSASLRALPPLRQPWRTPPARR